MKKTKGTLIVIDGTDGSGKATQVGLLIARLKKEGHKVEMLDFPDYYKNFFGKFVGECLSDPKYQFVNLDPKIASVLYAADRWESKKKIEALLSKGYIIVSNRYVSSNQIHQAGKIKTPKERKDFLQWLDTMEYKVFGIPRPDIVLYLSLPISISQKLMEARNGKGTRAYLNRKTDVHESSPEFLENSRKSAVKLIKELNNFVEIKCAPKKELLPIEAVHELVYTEVKKIIR